MGESKGIDRTNKQDCITEMNKGKTPSFPRKTKQDLVNKCVNTERRETTRSHNHGTILLLIIATCKIILLYTSLQVANSKTLVSNPFLVPLFEI